MQPDCDLRDCLTNECFPCLVSPTSATNSPAVAVMFPAIPEISITYKARMSFTDVIVYIASVMGLWFGLSVFPSNCLEIT